MTYEDVKRQRAEKEKRSVSPSELRVFRLTLMGVAGCQQRTAQPQASISSYTFSYEADFIIHE